jgi:two-component system, chemotaxis family, sensor histidine kinase and response regulator WspE
MSKMGLEDFSDLSMLELFRMEVETQSTVLTEGLLGLEQDSDGTQHLEELMRAAHSLKGAARIVGRQAAVRVAHAMEDCFVAAQEGKRTLSRELIDRLLAGVDLLNQIAGISEDILESWEAGQQKDIEAFLASLSSLAEAVACPSQASIDQPQVLPEETPEAGKQLSHESTPEATAPPENKGKTAGSDRAVRVTADNLNSLMGLAGEALVASRWLDGFAADLLGLKRLQHQLSQTLEGLRDSFPGAALNVRTSGQLIELRDRAASCQRSLAQRLVDLELFDRRFVNFSVRLYHEVLDCRMRPFADGIHGFRRMVRDVAHSMGKTVRLDIKGEATPVDRDILERLKAPLGHLLRNAIDHGIEGPNDRKSQGKPKDGIVELEACHSAGMLVITVADDGPGVDLEAVRRTVVRKKLTTLETAQKMTDAELLEFLILPGFTMKEAVSEISGRGVGLDVVQTTVKELGGRVRISSRSRSGTRFQLELPLTLSLIRTLLVGIGSEPYAFPLARVDRVLKLPRERIESVQGRQHFTFGDVQIGLVAAHQVLDLEGSPPADTDVSIVVLGDKTARYGLVIDRFLGERELVVRTLDPRLGKVKNISSAALMPDGSPVLIVDVDDLMRSIENVISGQRLSRIGCETDTGAARKQKRVLVVDDSLTVRELERKLLDNGGYGVDIAVDGMDGWNAVRTGHYDLVVTDVDMPRLDGIELVKLIRQDNRLKALPVMIVSYKDRPEDRSRGMEAGADYYLTKASFHDETLLRVVTDLIGSADS